MNTEILVGPELTMGGRLHVFSLYVDFAAAGRARWLTGRITRLAGDLWTISTEMWNLDSLTTCEPIRKMITQDASDADVLVIAMSSLDWREPELVQWLDSLAAGGTGRPGSRLFIGLLGDGRGRTLELDWAVKEFLRCARQMNRDFIWQWMGRDAMTDDGWVMDSMEPLLMSRHKPQGRAVFFPEAASEVA
jgi:hypothetical protein